MQSITKLLAIVAVTIAAFASPTWALSSKDGKKIAEAAKALVGTPYKWGGKAPATGLDCSGLTKVAYAAAGYNLPGTSVSQYSWCTMCTDKTGSLLFFDTDLNGSIDHVAINVGGGMMVHANSYYGKVVKESWKTPMWKQMFKGSGSR